MTMSQVYWIVKLDAIKDVCGGIGGLLIGLVCIFWIAYAVVMNTNFDKKSAKYFFVLAWVSIGLSPLPFVAKSMVPSTKEMCAIIVVPKVINAASQNDALKKMPNIILETANTWMRELTPSNIETGVKDVIKEIKK
jgi:hypothetical protein